MPLISEEDWALTLSGMLKQSESNLAEILTLMNFIMDLKLLQQQHVDVMKRIKGEIDKRNKYLADVLEFDKS